MPQALELARSFWLVTLGVLVRTVAFNDAPQHSKRFSCLCVALNYFDKGLVAEVISKAGGSYSNVKVVLGFGATALLLPLLRAWRGIDKLQQDCVEEQTDSPVSAGIHNKTIEPSNNPSAELRFGGIGCAIAGLVPILVALWPFAWRIGAIAIISGVHLQNKLGYGSRCAHLSMLLFKAGRKARPRAVLF